MSDTISLTRDEVAILLRAPNFEAYEKVSKRLVAFDRSPPAPAEHVVGVDRLIEAAKDVIASASDTYKKRNGHRGSFEDDSGEKCWIVPFDAFEGLRSATAALASTEGMEV